RTSRRASRAVRRSANRQTRPHSWLSPSRCQQRIGYVPADRPHPDPALGAGHSRLRALADVELHLPTFVGLGAEAIQLEHPEFRHAALEADRQPGIGFRYFGIE